MAFNNAFHNWQEICFPGRRSPISTITREYVSARIKTIWVQHGYTRKFVADLIGISEATLKAYENGDRLFQLDVAYQLAQIYGLAVDELIK